MRRMALKWRLHRTTVSRKILFLSRLCEVANLNELRRKQVSCFQFDDLETFEHSKLKPLSMTIAVDPSDRKILGFRVSQMAAKGLLARRSLKKYGPRTDERKLAREELFRELKPSILPNAVIMSDQNPHYISDVKKHFPQAQYIQFKGRRGCVVGQGELKAGGFDPLFNLNHNYAMFRANMNRLFRRTWCTTKKKVNLARHAQIYVWYHNNILTNEEKKKAHRFSLRTHFNPFLQERFSS